MNSLINILKFVFAVYIMFAHCGSIFGFNDFPYCQGGYIFVEWFYVLSGFTLARKIINLPADKPVYETSCTIIKDRIKSIFLFYIVSCTISLVIKMYTGQLVIENAWAINKIFHEYLMLQMWTMSVITLTGTSWFLSSMWLCLFILVPMLMKFKKKFAMISIIISVFLYLYIYKICGYLYHPDEWLIFTYKGNIRAMAALSLGIFGYMFGSFFKKFLNHPISESIILFLGNIAVIYYIFKVDDSICYFALPFIFMILISLEMSRKNFNLIPDCYITRLLGKLSMLLYMNHFTIEQTIQYLKPDMLINEKIYYTIVCSFVVSITIYLIFDGIPSIYKKIFVKSP